MSRILLIFAALVLAPRSMSEPAGLRQRAPLSRDALVYVLLCLEQNAPMKAAAAFSQASSE
jgi:hypothetical protein